jgi:hypothetical protein
MSYGSRWASHSDGLNVNIAWRNSDILKHSPFFFCTSEFWTQDLILAMLVCPFFTLVFHFQVGSLIFARASLRLWSFYMSSHMAEITSMYHHAQLIHWNGGGGGLPNFFTGLASKCNTPNLHLLSSCNYRHEPQCPAWNIILRENTL